MNRLSAIQTKGIHRRPTPDGYDTEALRDDDSTFGDADRLTGAIASFVWLAGTEHFGDPIDEASSHGTQGLLVVMAFADHQSPIDLS